ncbi:MAG: DUF3592 domain-containing protein [Hyphomicrobiales bacterium]
MTWTIPLSNKWRGSIFVVSGVVGLAVGMNAIYQDHLLSSEGVRTDGIVVGKDDTCSYRTCDKRLHFQFQSRDGTEFTSAEDVHHSIWSRLSRGDRVPITYYAQDPATYRFDLHSDHRQSQAKRFGFLFGVMFVLIGLGFLAFHRMENSRLRW